MSLSPAFPRRFSLVYDVLQQAWAGRPGVCPPTTGALEVAAYAVYALNSTVYPREEAETLANRGQIYSASQDGAVPGHQSSWLGCVMAQGQSWFAPRDVERIATSTTPAGVAAEQVKRLVLNAATRMKAVIVADSHYTKKFFGVFVNLPTLFILVRWACNRVLYGPPAVVTG